MREFQGRSNTLRSLQHEDAWRGCHSTGSLGWNLVRHDVLAWTAWQL